MSVTSPPRGRGATALALVTLLLSAPAAAQLVLDTSPPQLTVTSPSPGGLLAGVMVIEATAHDGLLGTGVAEVAYQLDGTTGPWTRMALGLATLRWTARWDVTGLANGGHSLYVRARDRAGNVRTVMVPVVVSAPPAAPTAARVTPPPAPSHGGYLDVSWNANIEADLAGYFLYRSNAAAGPFARLAVLSTPSFRDATVRNGTTYHYRVSAFDSAGNESEQAFAGHGTAWDTLAPTITEVSAHAVRSDRAVVQWRTDEPATSQVLYGKSTALGSFTPVHVSSLNTHPVTVSGLEPSTTYFYRVRSDDGSGNVSQSELFSFTTPEDLPPTVEIVSPSSGAVVLEGAKLQVAANDDVEVAAVEWTADGIDWTPMAHNALTGFHEASLAGLTDGAHTLGARAWDEIGQSALASVSFVLDRHAPGVEWVYPEVDAHLPGGMQYLFTVDAQDASLVSVDWQFFVVPPEVEMEEAPQADPSAWMPMTLNGGLWEATYLAPVVVSERVIYLYARAVDGTGKQSVITREVSLVPAGRELDFVGSRGQSLTGMVAIAPIGANGEHVIGIEMRGRSLTPGGTYTVTLSGPGGSHTVTLIGDGRGRARITVEEVTSFTDPAALTITLTGPGF